MNKNAIVIMFDSLQFNYLGCYGNTWIKTPNFDRFAREGVLFENCYIEGLPTVPCRRAMHTGRYTLPVNGWVPLTMQDTTIADLCWGRPIDTALIFDCPMYRLPKFGYTRGFDKVYFSHGHEADHYFYEQDPLLHYKVADYVEDHVIEAGLKKYGGAGVAPTLHEIECYLKQRQGAEKAEDRYVARTISKAITYLEQVDRNKQFFLWIDSFDPHEPWDPPSVYDPNAKCQYNPEYQGKDQFLPLGEEVDGVYTESELHHIRMLYAELITLCDTYFGNLLDCIRKLGLEENTLMLVVSDHGEPLGNAEHGHGIMRKCRPWPYEELVHGVMMLRAPNYPAGKRIKSFVQSVDVAPTICDWLGIGVHPDMQGKSLLDLAQGKVEKVRDFAIAGYYKYSWSIITEDWSYIHWPKLEKSMDPSAATDLIVSEVNKASTHLNALGGATFYGEVLENSENSVEERHKQAASLDGESQWTCTPGSTSEVPQNDELFDRKNDPFQLHNLIHQHQDVAKDLFDTLRTHMSTLRAS